MRSYLAMLPGLKAGGDVWMWVGTGRGCFRTKNPVRMAGQSPLYFLWACPMVMTSFTKTVLSSIS